MVITIPDTGRRHFRRHRVPEAVWKQPTSKPGTLLTEPRLPIAEPRLGPKTAPADEAGLHPRSLSCNVCDKTPSVTKAIDEQFRVLNGSVREMRKDPALAVGMECAVVEFNTEVVSTPFTPLATFEPVQALPVGGTTLLGAAGMAALDLIEAREKELRTTGVQVGKKFLFIFSDFVSGDPLEPLVARLAAANSFLHVVAVGIGDVDTASMHQVAAKGQAFVLRDEQGVPRFDEFYRWVRRVFGIVSVKGPNAPLPPIPEELKRPEK